MARKDTAVAADGEKKPGRLKQIRQTYRMARRTDRWIGWITLGVFLMVFLLALALILLLGGNPWLWGIFAVTTGMLAATIVFGRRVEKAAYSQLDGQPGAAMAALQTLRRGWTVTPVIAATRHQDVVHRVVGRSGVILVGEGQPSRVLPLVADQKRRHQRIIGDIPVTDLIVGDGPDQVPLRKLNARVQKMPKVIRPAEVTELKARLKAMPSSPVAMPKGPMPKGVRMPKMPNQPR